MKHIYNTYSTYIEIQKNLDDRNSFIFRKKATQGVHLVWTEVTYKTLKEGFAFPLVQSNYREQLRCFHFIFGKLSHLFHLYMHFMLSTNTKVPLKYCLYQHKSSRYLFCESSI